MEEVLFSADTGDGREEDDDDLTSSSTKSINSETTKVMICDEETTRSNSSDELTSAIKKDSRSGYRSEIFEEERENIQEMIIPKIMGKPEGRVGIRGEAADSSLEGTMN